MSKYISVVDTAKLIRKVLKKEFPGVKFSVRSKSYSMGASIDIRWVDGPTSKQVDVKVQPFSGAGFDGMIDLKYYTSSWLLPDGSVRFAKSSGTEGSRGIVSSFDVEKPDPDAELVRFGADYVFTSRSFSKEFLQKVADDFNQETGWDQPEILVSDYDGSAGYKFTPQAIPGGMHYQTIDREYTHQAHQVAA